MLLMLVQNLQLLYHNHQQQVDMEKYMNYMLLNPPQGINRRAAMASMLGGLLRCFWCILWCHLQARHMCYSVSSAFERSRVNGHVSGACCEWTEDFFDIDFSPFALSSSCGSSLKARAADPKGLSLTSADNSWRARGCKELEVVYIGKGQHFATHHVKCSCGFGTFYLMFSLP